MTVPSSSRAERGGAIRSSSARSSLAVLVMAPDSCRRSDWAHYFELLGLRTIRCAGPQATTCALTLGVRCPLQDEADCIFYDEQGITPDLEFALRALPPDAPIAYARSERDPGGRERPVPTHVVARRRPAT